MNLRNRLLTGRATALALTLVLAGCGAATETRPASRPLLHTGQPRFDVQQVAWAHRFELHYGDQTFTLERAIRGLEVTDYGFFVRLAETPDDMYADSRWGFFDGTTVQELGERVSDLAVSADGRYAGWIDRAGPLRPAGRVAEVVVVDLESGKQIFADAHGMGGDVGDDLGDRYEELPPQFLGFDWVDGRVRWAYWRNASGSGERMRWRLGTATIEPAATEDSQGMPADVGHAVDAYAGQFYAQSPEFVGIGYPEWSPTGAFVVDISAPSRIRLYDARSLKPIPVAFGARAQHFGGWLPGDRFYVIASATRVTGYDPAQPDRTRGRIVVCTLPSGECTPGDRVPGLREAVLPHRDQVLG